MGEKRAFQSEFEKIYADLYDDMTKPERHTDIADNKVKAAGIQFTKMVNRPMLTSFTAIKGTKYDNEKNALDKDFRFMLVGRAVNGWDERRHYDDILDRAEYIASSLENLGVNSAIHNEGFTWVGKSENGEAPKNQYRDGIDFDADLIEQQPYSLSRPFWEYAKEIWCGLSGNDAQSAWQNRWIESIIWTNLYKIAPFAGGNPDETLKKIQQEGCIKLLEKEIEYFRPTHILFMTDYQGWFEHFSRLFEKDEKNEANTYIKWTGCYHGPEVVSKVVVAVRPEMKTKTEYVKSVLAAFGCNLSGLE